MLSIAVPSLHKFVAILLFVLWTPVASHCLIEVALGHEETGCCESGGPAESGHSECPACLSIENGQAKTDSTILPAPKMLDVAQEIFNLALSGSWPSVPVIRQPDDTPPVPRSAVIRLAISSHPVRGPTQVG